MLPLDRQDNSLPPCVHATGTHVHDNQGTLHFWFVCSPQCSNYTLSEPGFPIGFLCLRGGKDRMRKHVGNCWTTMPTSTNQSTTEKSPPPPPFPWGGGREGGRGDIIE